MRVGTWQLKSRNMRRPWLEIRSMDALTGLGDLARVETPSG